MVNINKLRARLVEKRLTIVDTAGLMGISKSALYRKLHRPQYITIYEAEKLKEILELTDDEAIEIFLK